MSYATPVAATPPEFIYAEDLPGEIADHVSSADGATVEFYHKNNVQMVFINFTILLYYLILGKRYIGQKTEQRFTATSQRFTARVTTIREGFRRVQEGFRRNSIAMGGCHDFDRRYIIIVIFLYYTN